MQLFEAVFLDGSPQVHVHFLTDEEGFRLQGYGMMEMVCHSCGTARLIVYDAHHNHTRHSQLRNAFREKHVACANRSFENHCPDYRRSIEVFDTRRAIAVKPRVRPRPAKSAR